MAVPFEMLLHPELLSNEQLIQILQERHLRVENLQRMRRDELLDLFHQFCVPYGQRRYRDSGRGKVLNKTRNISPELVTTYNTFDNKSMIKINRKTLHSDSDRLKPPPDTLSGQMKRIKLENNLTSTDNISKNKRRMSVDAVTTDLGCTPIKKERKPITWP
uniref:Ashwin n=1 Tax=Heliconius erato TaxID=33431 RepID=L7X3Z0_HELEA|nr:ashwin-like protein [Heliconius erato]